jgi:hypothetical protein
MVNIENLVSWHCHVSCFVFIIPRRWNREEDIVLALSVRQSFHPSVRASSLQLLSGIQQNFMGTINTKRSCAYHGLVPVGLLNTELWPFIMHIEQ